MVVVPSRNLHWRNTNTKHQLQIKTLGNCKVKLSETTTKPLEQTLKTQEKESVSFERPPRWRGFSEASDRKAEWGWTGEQRWTSLRKEKGFARKQNTTEKGFIRHCFLLCKTLLHFCETRLGFGFVRGDCRSKSFKYAPQNGEVRILLCSDLRWSRRSLNQWQLIVEHAKYQQLRRQITLT